LGLFSDPVNTNPHKLPGEWSREQEPFDRLRVKANPPVPLHKGGGQARPGANLKPRFFLGFASSE